MPHHTDTACDLSTPEVLFQSLPPTGARDIHLISFDGFGQSRHSPGFNLQAQFGDENWKGLGNFFSGAEFGRQPSPREPPVSQHRVGRDIQYLGRLLDA